MNLAIERAIRYSDSQIDVLRSRLSNIVLPNDVVVLTCGSFARREASEKSDIDFFIITQQSSSLFPKSAPWVNSVKDAISEIIPAEPSSEGPFAKVEPLDAMLINIGGNEDSNQKITRRMLFLLEGEWLFNESGLRYVRKKILERYIPERLGDHQLTLFLLNDVIRYYRTVAVDYEFKTVEGTNPKPWGIRNIKLVFSRKLLYASGLFSVALTVDCSRNKKIAILEELFAVPVIDRMIRICGQQKMERVLLSYDRFLERLEDADVRDHLKNLNRDQRDDPVFRDLKNLGHDFTREVLKLFEDMFHQSHPIRRAVVL